jgi:hypothetical protein
MTRAEEFRQRAQEAEEQADKVRDPSAKQGFLDVARRYREMAGAGVAQWPRGWPNAMGHEPRPAEKGPSAGQAPGRDHVTVRQRRFAAALKKGYPLNDAYGSSAAVTAGLLEGWLPYWQRTSVHSASTSVSCQYRSSLDQAIKRVAPRSTCSPVHLMISSARAEQFRRHFDP